MYLLLGLCWDGVLPPMGIMLEVEFLSLFCFKKFKKGSLCEVAVMISNGFRWVLCDLKWGYDGFSVLLWRVLFSF